MILYDRTSSITWARRGTMTVEQMAEVPQLSQLLAEPSVLFDNGAGTVYDWRLLSVECARYGVECTGDEDADYAALVEAMNAPIQQPPTIEEVDAKATNALTTADSVQEQMDALTSAFATEEANNA